MKDVFTEEESKTIDNCLSHATLEHLSKIASWGIKGEIVRMDFLIRNILIGKNIHFAIKDAEEEALKLKEKWDAAKGI